MLNEFAQNGLEYIERDYYERKNIIPSGTGIVASAVTFDWEVKAHAHDFFEIEIILDGTARHNINGVKYDLSRGDAYFISPADWHSIKPTSPITRINIAYTENADISRYLFDMITSKAPAICKFNEDELSIIEQMAGLIFADTTLDGEYRERYLRNINESILLLTLSKLMIVPSVNANKKLLTKAIQYISTNFKKQISLCELAEVSELSKTYFSHIFNQTFGTNINEYINDIRLDYAKNQLTMTNELVTTIAEEAGFKSYSLFSRLFKAKYGISPASLRKK